MTVDSLRLLEWALGNGYVIRFIVPAPSAKAAGDVQLKAAQVAIMMTNFSKNDNRRIVTNDKRTIDRAEEQLRRQREASRIVIEASCIAEGGASFAEAGWGVDQLVASLDGYNGWKFVRGDKNEEFTVHMEIGANEATADGAMALLRTSLDGLAAHLGIGIEVAHWSSGILEPGAPAYALVPNLRGTAMPGGKAPRVTQEDLARMEKALASEEGVKVAWTLNKAYAESWLTNRLWQLWAAVEEIFGGNAQPLLDKRETNRLVSLINSVESMKNSPERLGSLRNVLLSADKLALDKGEVEEIVQRVKGIDSLSGDPTRAKKLRDALSDGNCISRIGRNERIARAVADLMGISQSDAKREIDRASKIRGGLGHGVPENFEGIQQAEEFLHEVLRRYFVKLGNSESEK